MNKNTKFCMTIWIIVMIIPMLFLTAMQPLPGTEEIRRTRDGTDRIYTYTVTITDYVLPYLFFIIATFVVWFFTTAEERLKKGKLIK